MQAKQSQAADTLERRQAAAVADDSALLDVHAVAAMLGCSARHVYRLSDSGRMPPPVKLGALVRWKRTSLFEWIQENCPSVRSARAAIR